MTDTPHTDVGEDEQPLVANDAPVEAAEIVELDSEPPEVRDESTAPEPEPTAELLGLALPDDPEEAKTVLLRELQESRQESGELLANLQRVAAEFDNFRKRVERDQIENVQRASQRVIESILPTLDSIDAALTHDPTTDGEEKILAGLRGTQALLFEALEREGFAPIEAVGLPFDPAVHEAVSIVPGEGDQIVEQELRKGYTMRGRVIRPTLVVVGHA